MQKTSFSTATRGITCLFQLRFQFGSCDSVSHVRQNAKRDALDGIGRTQLSAVLSAGDDESYDTNDNTKADFASVVSKLMRCRK
jgi:hypothetical protein